jgi:hypothetical protein
MAVSGRDRRSSMNGTHRLCSVRHLRCPSFERSLPGAKDDGDGAEKSTEAEDAHRRSPGVGAETAL